MKKNRYIILLKTALLKKRVSDWVMKANFKNSRTARYRGYKNPVSTILLIYRAQKHPRIHYESSDLPHHQIIKIMRYSQIIYFCQGLNMAPYIYMAHIIWEGFLSSFSLSENFFKPKK